MKRTTFVLLALLIFASFASAQILCVQDQLYFKTSLTQSSQLKKGATDSTVTSTTEGIWLVYQGTKYPRIVGQFPDSVKVVTYATADSVHDFLIRFKAANAFGNAVGTYTSVLVDSNKTSTAAASFTRKLITASYYNSYDVVGVSVVASSDNVGAIMKANSSKVYVILERYFTIK